MTNDDAFCTVDDNCRGAVSTGIAFVADK